MLHERSSTLFTASFISLSNCDSPTASMHAGDDPFFHLDEESMSPDSFAHYVLSFRLRSPHDKEYSQYTITHNITQIEKTSTNLENITRHKR